MRDLQGLRDLWKVTCRRVFILHHAGAADHFQISNFCEISQNLVLHAVSKERKGFVFTEIFKRQYRDRLRP